MHERSLRTVLMVRAIEESDRAGEVLPLADRAEATRMAVRADSKLDRAFAGGHLSSTAQRVLARRADLLRERLELRAPVIGRLLTLVGGVSRFAQVLLILALLSGISLSALDGSRQINILAFPLVGLIAWNILIYILLITSLARRRGVEASPWLTGLYERWVRGRADSLLKHSSRFNAPLAEALRRFAVDWSTLAHPLIFIRARRLLHLAALLAAVGLVVGLYVRGIVFRYEAGWESTFLGPDSVRRFLGVLYGPASAISGIPLPESAGQVEALRWEASPGQHDAAPWIHLIALTAALYIVLPRLLAIVLTSFSLWRVARNPPIPPALLAYARGILLGAAGDGRASAQLVTYAYEPEPTTLEGIEALLSGALGGDFKIEAVTNVRYGDEDELASRREDVGSAASFVVLLFNLATTPEAENHGAVLTHLRERLTRRRSATPLLVVIDEAPYGARMRGDASYEQRLEERRRAWSTFVAAHGLKCCIVDLSQIKAGGAAVNAMFRDAVQAAVWTPGA